jgi:hypothetical protein
LPDGKWVDIQNLAAWGEFIGGIGGLLAAIAVIVSLLYLARQLRQNTSQLGVASTQSTLGAIYQNNLFVVDHPDLQSLLRKGLRDYRSLDAAERDRFHVFWMTNFIAYQDGYLQFKKSLIENDSWRPIEAHLFRYSAMPGLQEWWNKERVAFGDAFVTYVERGTSETG